MAWGGQTSGTGDPQAGSGLGQAGAFLHQPATAKVLYEMCVIDHPPGVQPLGPSLGWVAIIGGTVNVRSLAASFINVKKGSFEFSTAI